MQQLLLAFCIWLVQTSVQTIIYDHVYNQIGISESVQEIVLLMIAHLSTHR